MTGVTTEQGTDELAQLCAQYPHEWTQVTRQIARLVESGDEQGLKDYVARAARPAFTHADHRMTREREQALEARRRMVVEVYQRASFTASTGVSEGIVRFNQRNGRIAQRLLFETGLERRAVSLPAFRLTWPLLSQRRYLMPLVEPQGIYCFYSKTLLRGLGRLIGGRPVLEVAAGDGTLARLLRDRGHQVEATDDHSWSHLIDYPGDVAQEPAARSLARIQPRVVLCSWPPAGNTFERAVFATPSVATYIALGTRSRHACSDWAAYAAAEPMFTMAVDERLSRAVLPPEIGPAVYVFQRRTTT